WKAARGIGIHIPTLCYDENMEHFTSCMICMVKEKKSGRLLPACSAPVADGMEIETLNDEIRAFRKSTLELLLSDHVGDCEAPCERLCNAPCERGCRRGKHDEPLSIRELVRHVADWDLRRDSPFVPEAKSTSG